MDATENRNAKPNSPNSQTTTISSENSTTPSSPILSEDYTSSPESVITELKNDTTLLAANLQEQEIGSASASASIQQVQSPRLSWCYEAGGRIFTATGGTGTPGEWSVASNESLFSIQVGNFSCTSFSATPMFRSGELSGSAAARLDHHLRETTPPFPVPRLNDALCNIQYSYAWANNRPGLRDATFGRNQFTNQSFQFPVLPGGRDGGWISSPTLSELKRRRTAEQILHPPQPLLHIMQRRKQPQRLSKSKSDHHYSSIITRFFCFSKYCCTPCRRNGP